MWLDLEGVVGRKGTEARPAPPEAFDQAQRNLAIARRRRALQGRIVAEISPDSDGELRWYALLVAPSHERIAAAHLAARRFGIYLPTYDEMVMEGGRWRFRQRPILPGYVFVSSIGLAGRWRRALACPGVTSFLNRAGTDMPGTLPQSFIDELRAYEADENSRFDRIHGRSPDGATKKKSRKARRSYKVRRAKRQARVRSP